MSLNLNKVVLCGRLTATPELKQTTSGVSTTNFTLAVNRRYSKDKEQQADFINIVAWRQTAEFITKYFDKGNAICITGSIQTRSWETSKGEKRYATDVVADEAMFVDGKEKPEISYNPNARMQCPTEQKPVEPKFDTISVDEPLPF